MKLYELLEVMKDSEQVVITYSEDGSELEDFKGIVRILRTDFRIRNYEVVVFYFSKADSLIHILTTSE